MKRYGRGARLFAGALAVTAGFVDAIGFLVTGGFFVSFMSGNSTRMAVGIFEADDAGVMALGLIAAFVLGVAAGAVAGRLCRTRRALVILVLVSLLLAVAAILLAIRPGDLSGVLLLAAAMGAENAVFAEEGEVAFGVTYMTGALAKLGDGLAAALFGGPPLAWLPYLLLWLGLAGGVLLGAVAFDRLGIAALWGGAAACLVLAAASPAFRLAPATSAVEGGRLPQNERLPTE